VTTTILAILMSAPFSTAVDCSEIVGYDEKKNAYLMECTLAVGGKTRDKTKLIPVYCIMDMKESAFMCKFNLKPKSSSDTVPRGRTGLLPQLPPGAVLQSTVLLPKRSLRPICLPAVRSPELNDELSQ
jgi:hypothetical protein